MTIFIIGGILLFGILLYLGHKKKKIEPIIEYSPIESELTQFEDDLLDLVNEYRLSKDLDFVDTDELLRGIANEHTKYMISVSGITHFGFANRANIILEHGGLTIGENVGYGFSTAKGFMNGYINSDSHRAILEGEHFTHIGIKALKDSNNRYYNTLLFAQYKI